jgi:hypothetical protein
LAIGAPGGNAVARSVYSWATAAASPLLNAAIHFALAASISELMSRACAMVASSSSGAARIRLSLMRILQVVAW